MIPENRIGGKIDRCCNPFNLKHYLKKKALRSSLPAIIKKIPTLHSDYLLCGNCRKNILSSDDLSRFSVDDRGKTISNSIMITISFSTIRCLKREDSELSVLIQLPVINQGLKLIGNSPILKRRRENVGSSSWMATIQQVSQSLKQMFGVKFGEAEIAIHDLALMIAQIKEAFHASGTLYEWKIELMTMLPKTWSISHMAQTIGSTYHMAKVAKNLATQGEVLSMDLKGKDRCLPAELVHEVVNFYHNDDVSSLRSGKKECLSRRNNEGVRVQYQKRLLLGNLRELYQRFKEIHPDMSIGFSSFAELRPDYCVLTGSGGTHTVCVCSSHQNFKLMMTGDSIHVFHYAND